MAGFRDLRTGVGVWKFGPTTSPTVAEPSPVQTTLPTSAYGETIPVIWGKARLPGAYIWVAPIVTVTETHVEWWDTVTTTTSAMTARLRFARPLVPDSTWSVRRIWAQGKLIYDGSSGYRAKGLVFRFYDGRSTQGRDKAMTREEGTANVSAHRGYLDIVLENFNIFDIGAPPTVEAEFVQAVSTDPDIDTFQAFFSDEISTIAALNLDEQEFYGYSATSGQIRRFSITGLRELYAIEVTGSFTFMDRVCFRYIPESDRILCLTAGFAGWPWRCTLIDPVSGAVTAQSDGAGSTFGTDPNQASCHVRFGGSSLLLTASAANYLAIFKVTTDAVATGFKSSASWGGYSRIYCISAEEPDDSQVTVWVCADNKLLKLLVGVEGNILTTTEFATFADDLVYGFPHDNSVIVWTDNATVMSINATTGATEWTKTVPYQISSTPSAQAVTAPDTNNFVDVFFIQGTAAYYFTDLDTGTTTSIAKGSSLVLTNVYDEDTKTVVTTKNSDEPVRTRFDVPGTGDLRDLSDLLKDLMTFGGGFDASEIVCINIDDQIQGAVFDITAGTREIARSICEPYSIAIFEGNG